MEFPVEADKEVQLLAVGLADESGAPIDAPMRDRPFAVRVRFRVSERVGGIDVGVYLVTKRGVRVIDERWSDRERGVAPAEGTGEWRYP